MTKVNIPSPIILHAASTLRGIGYKAAQCKCIYRTRTTMPDRMTSNQYRRAKKAQHDVMIIIHMMLPWRDSWDETEFGIMPRESRSSLWIIEYPMNTKLVRISEAKFSRDTIYFCRLIDQNVSNYHSLAQLINPVNRLSFAALWCLVMVRYRSTLPKYFWGSIQ